MNEPASRFGFRHLTPENFLTPDHLSSLWALRNRETGEFRSMTAEDWAASILQVQLEQYVPADLHRAFEIARAPMLYAYFFYPLFAVGLGQLVQVCEMATRVAVELLDAPSSCQNFQARIDWLRKEGVFSEETAERWHAGRRIRNKLVHEFRPSPLPPTVAMGELETTVTDINSLFADVQTGKHGL